MNITKALALLGMAGRISNRRGDSQAVKGPGTGNKATNAFLKELRENAFDKSGEVCSEQRICGHTAHAVDFYFQSEATIVEVALGIPNSATEYEKDVLKAIMAKENGYKVDRLFFISRPGAAEKCQQPGRAWLKDKHGIETEVHELAGEPRRPVRN